MNWLQRATLALNKPLVNLLETASRDLAAFRELKESYSDLELDMNDQGWQRMVAAGRREFSPAGRRLIIEISRLFAIKNPIIGRGCRISAYYVFGRGVDVKSDNPQAHKILEDFWMNPRNSSELSPVALYESHIAAQTDGNVFYALPTNRLSGEVLIRSIDALEIAEIITDPDDSSVPWYYKRVWYQDSFDTKLGILTPVQKTSWYPAVDFYPKARPDTIGGEKVEWGIPIVHYKTGAPKKWRFGLSRVYPAIDWATAYRKLLADYCKKAENLARFGHKITTKGGQKSVDAIQNTLESTYAVDRVNPRERNPAPQTGAAAVFGAGITMDAIKTAGANTDPEEGRRVAHMAYMCFDFDERFFGDVDVGSLATGTSMDRPTELACRSQQEGWEDVLTTVGRYVISVKSRAPGQTGKELREAKIDSRTVQVMVSFPAIITQDPDKAIAAIKTGFTMGSSDGKCAGTLDPKTAAGMIANVLGVEDAQATIEKMYPAASYDPAEFAANPIEEPPIDPAGGVPVPAGPRPSRSSPNPQAA